MMEVGERWGTISRIGRSSKEKVVNGVRGGDWFVVE
jgi:hypothetical protein